MHVHAHGCTFSRTDATALLLTSFSTILVCHSLCRQGGFCPTTDGEEEGGNNRVLVYKEGLAHLQLFRHPGGRNGCFSRSSCCLTAARRKLGVLQKKLS